MLSVSCSSSSGTIFPHTVQFNAAVQQEYIEVLGKRLYEDDLKSLLDNELLTDVVSTWFKMEVSLNTHYYSW